MVHFNASRYGFSGGNLSDGFQGRPDLSPYRQSIKESQNFHSGQDGVMRLRKGADNSNNAAPKSDSSNDTTGTVKTIRFFAKGDGSAESRWIFLDFCKDKTTGKFTTVYQRDEVNGGWMGVGILGDPQYVEPTIVSNTVDGDIVLS